MSDWLPYMGDDSILTQNEGKTMKYRVTTDQLENFSKGSTIEKSCDGDGYVSNCEINMIRLPNIVVENNPDWFEPVEQVQEGSYYRYSGDVFRASKPEGDNYGYEWRLTKVSGNNTTCEFISQSAETIVNDYNKLSTHEIGQALIKEAKRRGLVDKKIESVDIGKFKYRDHYRTYNTNSINKCKVSDSSWYYNAERDYLASTGYGYPVVVYSKGEFAEPIDQTPHIEINGKTIQVEDGTVKISCGDTIEEDMFKNFYAVVNKYNLDVSRNGEDINDQLQQIWDEIP